MSIQGFYTGKNILLTGATGFLGKVVLEKFLRVLPQINKLFILIRLQKEETLLDRFNKNIITLPLFERLRKQQGPKFDQYIQDKIVLIQADLLQENLNLSESDFQLLISNVNIIIHCAASVDFQAELYNNININIIGSLRMFDLAKNVQNLDNFIHVSTCYVNTDKKGYIEETVYESSEDPDDTLNHLLKMSRSDMKKNEKNILGAYPNTYVYTKALMERLYVRRKPQNMNINIVRPSIIGASFRDPYTGWVEGVAASSAVFLMGGVGVVKYLPGSNKTIGDVIPVDYVSDYIIVVGALMLKQQNVNVFHASTSSKNPVTWGFARDLVEIYWSNSPPENRVQKPNVSLVPNKNLLNFLLWTRSFPITLAQKSLQVIGYKKYNQQLQRAEKILKKSELIGSTFEFFILNDWIFDSRKSDYLMSRMSEDEKQTFLLDTTNIEWFDYFLMYNFGIQRYILNELVDPPNSSNLLNRQKISYFSDIQWTLQGGKINYLYDFTKGKVFYTKNADSFVQLIMNSKLVQTQMNNLIEKRVQKKSQQMKAHTQIHQIEIENEVKKLTSKICYEMCADYNMKVLRVFAWTLHKIFKQIYETVIVQDNGILQQMKNHDSKQNGPLVLIPTHRSYIDFLIVSYIFYAYKIQCPHIAAAEDFLKMALVPHILRMSGAFFLKRKYADEFKGIYKATLYEYIQRLLVDDCFVEFFIEGTRSRNFKMQMPKFGILNTVFDAVHEKKIQDAIIIPISISYEKVLEGDTYPYELMGEEKVKESLARLVKAAKILNQNYGKIHIKCSPPISVKNFISQHSSDVKPAQIIENLGFRITYELQDNLVIMPTFMVAAIMLMHRKGIMEHILISKVEWLTNEILKRKYLVSGVSEHSGAAISVRNSIKLLGGIIQQTKKSVFELSVAPKQDFKNILMLNYYRNGLFHVLCLEAICACALTSFGYKKISTTGVEIQEYIDQIMFLHNLLRKEFVQRVSLKKLNNCQQFLQEMQQRGVIQINTVENKTFVKIQDENMINFLCSLIWPNIESYWLACVYMFTLKNDKKHIVVLDQLPQHIQWFAENLFDERIVEHKESCSLDSIKNAVNKFKKLNYFIVENQQLDNGTEIKGVVKSQILENDLIALEKRINRFMKRTYMKSPSTALELAKRTVFADYPSMSKL